MNQFQLEQQEEFVRQERNHEIMAKREELNAKWEIAQSEHEHQTRLLELDREMTGRKLSVDRERFERDMVLKKQADELAGVDDEMTRRKIGAENTENPSLKLIKNLPDILRGLNVGEININKDLIVGIIESIKKAQRKDLPL